MVDTLVVGTAFVALDRTGRGPIGPFWSDISIAVILAMDSGSDMVFHRTTNKGTGWSETEIRAGTSETFDGWYDKETPGDSGNLVHALFLDSAVDDAFYRTVDVSDGSQGTLRTVDAGITVSTVSNNNRVAITKTRSGNLIAAFSTQAEIECYRSVDDGATWVDIADVYESASQEDWVMLFPADTGDDDDACALFWDRSVDELSVKMWDNSAGTWTETSIASSMVDSNQLPQMDGVIRHSNGHLYVFAWSALDSNFADILTWDITVDSIASPTITARTNVVTDQGESGGICGWINQQSNEVRVMYLQGGTWQASTIAVYHISTDGMVSWGTEQAYGENTADDNRSVQAGRSVGNAGGRYQPSWFNDDLDDIFVNEVNDAEIAATGLSIPVVMHHRSKNIGAS